MAAECNTYISHVRGVRFCARGCAAAAALQLLQVEAGGIQWVNVRVCRDHLTCRHSKCLETLEIVMRASQLNH